MNYQEFLELGKHRQYLNGSGGSVFMYLRKAGDEMVDSGRVLTSDEIVVGWGISKWNDHQDYTDAIFSADEKGFNEAMEYFEHYFKSE